MKKLFLFGLFMLTGFLFFLSSTMPANAFELGARAYYWFSDFNADFKVDGATLKGTQISTRDDLDLGREESPSVEIYGGLGKHHISLMYTPVDYSGRAPINRNINFNGTSFAAGTVIDTDLKLKMLDLEYQYDLLNMENILAGFSLGVIGKIKYLDVDARLNAKAIALETSESLKAPIPMIGVGAHIGILANILEARAKLTGAGYSSSNMIYEAMADLSLTPFPFVDIHGGYKVIKLKVDRSDVFIDANFSGPYVGLAIGF
jgi:hypothetical protein